MCGVTCAEDAVAAAEAGADAIGTVCHADAPRRVGRERVAEIAGSLPPFVSMVLLFVDAPDETVASYRAAAPHAMLQFHGSETAKRCASHGAAHIKAVRPGSADDAIAAMREHANASAILYDGGGGQGRAFDWGFVPPRAERSLPVIVAGGLGPANVAEAIEATDPDAVDVSSGVCVDGDPLRKDPAKIADFVAAVRFAGA